MFSSVSTTLSLHPDIPAPTPFSVGPAWQRRRSPGAAPPKVFDRLPPGLWCGADCQQVNCNGDTKHTVNITTSHSPWILAANSSSLSLPSLYEFVREWVGEVKSCTSVGTVCVTRLYTQASQWFKLREFIIEVLYDCKQIKIKNATHFVPWKSDAITEAILQTGGCPFCNGHVPISTPENTRVPLDLSYS